MLTLEFNGNQESWEGFSHWMKPSDVAWMLLIFRQTFGETSLFFYRASIERLSWFLTESFLFICSVLARVQLCTPKKASTHRWRQRVRFRRQTGEIRFILSRQHVAARLALAAHRRVWKLNGLILLVVLKSRCRKSADIHLPNKVSWHPSSKCTFWTHLSGENWSFN